MFAIRCGHVAHSMDPDAFSSLKAFSTFRAYPTAVYWCYGNSGTVGTLRLCWLRMSPKPRGTTQRKPCKHPFSERAVHPNGFG
jgi:hypothetical protein